MLRVLTYHRVLPAWALSFSPSTVWSAAPDVFEQQMRHLARHYRVVSMAEVLEALERRKSLPRRSVLLTFDDGYRDFGDHAWPVLRRWNLPATLFVPTAYPGRPERVFWWDRLSRAFALTPNRHVSTPIGRLELRTPAGRLMAYRRVNPYLKRLPHLQAMALVDRLCEEMGVRSHEPRSQVLGWSRLRRLAREGVTIGAHGRSHALLTALSPDEAREEIRGARRDIEARIGKALPVFSYPGGAYDERARALVAEEGYRIAFTTVDGHNDLGRCDSLLLRRTSITPRTTLAVFRLRLLWLMSHLDRWRHRKAA